MNVKTWKKKCVNVEEKPNTEGDRKSVEGQSSWRMDVTRLEHEMSKFTYGKVGGIQCLSHH
jgi:hypothetical protein